MSEDKAVCVIFLAGCRLCFWPCFVPSPIDHRLYGTYSPSRVHWSLHPISKLLGGCERCLSCAPNMRKLSFGDSATLVGNPTTAALAAPTSLSRDIVTSKSKHVWTDLAFMLNLFGLSKYVKNLRGVRLLSFGLVRRHWRQRGLEASPQGTLFLSVLKKSKEDSSGQGDSDSKPRYMGYMRYMESSLVILVPRYTIPSTWFQSAQFCSSGI